MSGAVIAPDDAVAALRSRLLSLRADALRQLAEADTLDAGMLALLGNDGERMTLVLYAEANKAAFAAACPRARWRSHRVGASEVARMMHAWQIKSVRPCCVQGGADHTGGVCDFALVEKLRAPAGRTPRPWPAS